MTDPTDYETDRDVLLKNSDAKLRPNNFLGLWIKRGRNLLLSNRLTDCEPLVAYLIKQFSLARFDEPIVPDVCNSLVKKRMTRPPAREIPAAFMMNLQKGQVQ